MDRVTPADALREMRTGNAQHREWAEWQDTALSLGQKNAEQAKEIKRLREALAHYATDETADGWIAIAALAATEEDKP